MEQWLRDNKLQESGAQLALDPIVQASQLLQARKTDSDVESICEMCSKLTIAQVSVFCFWSVAHSMEFLRQLFLNKKSQEKHAQME